MNKEIIRVEDVYKEYRLGVIGGGTLQGDLQSAWARLRKKEDPNSKIGARTYGKNEKFMALNGVNFSVNRGDTLGVIGHNGAGKSTLLKLLSRVTAPTKGKIYLNGRISSMLEVGTGFHPELTGRENIYLNGAILGMSKKEIDSKIDQIIEFSECGQFIETPVKRYSSGMYVKLAFSVAAHLDSDILVMDEVLAVGDMKFQQKCLGKMGDVANYDGRTVLYVSHNMSTIRQLCNRCIVMNHGTVIYDGDTNSAIEIYLKGKYEDMGTYRNLKDHAIPSYCNKKVVVQEFRFVETESVVFEPDSMVKTVLRLKCNNDIEKLYIRYSIRSLDGAKIGASITTNGLRFSAGEESDVQVNLNVSNLVASKYLVVITLYEQNEFGTQQFTDLIDDAFSFEIAGNPSRIAGLDWMPSKLGYVVCPELEVEKI